MAILNHNQLGHPRPISTILPDSFNRGKFLLTLVFAVYLSISLIIFIWAFHSLIKVNTLLVSLVLIFLSVKIRKEYSPIYAYTGFLVAFFLISSIFVGRSDWRLFTPILFIVSGLGVALIMLRGYIYSWGGYATFYALAGYFLYLIFTGVQGSAALKYCSYNNISMLMLAACIPLYVISDTEKKNIDLKPAILTLIVSIWGIGRSGIISSFVLFLGLLSVKIKAGHKYTYRLIIGFSIALLYLHVTDYAFLHNAIAHHAERGSLFSDGARTTMWANYLNNLDLPRIIFGVNVEEDFWEDGELNSYNYHSSFINLHSQTGIMGLITMGLIILALFRLYKTHKVFFFLLLSLVLRASVDLYIFFGVFDFIPFFFIFYYLSGKQGSKATGIASSS